MPLQKGSSQKAVNKNFHELLLKYRKTGKVGTSRPTSLSAAAKQVAAIAYKTARKSKSK